MSKQYQKVYKEYVPAQNQRAPERVVPMSRDDTFRNLLFQYSCDRMDTDPSYRKAVHKAVRERRAERRAREAARATALKVKNASNA